MTCCPPAQRPTVRPSEAACDHGPTDHHRDRVHDRSCDVGAVTGRCVRPGASAGRAGGQPRQGVSATMLLLRSGPLCRTARLPVRLAARNVEIFDGPKLVARHERAVGRYVEVLTPDYYLDVLKIKPGGMPGATALAQAKPCGVFTASHQAYWEPPPRGVGGGLRVRFHQRRTTGLNRVDRRRAQPRVPRRHRGPGRSTQMYSSTSSTASPRGAVTRRCCAATSARNSPAPRWPTGPTIVSVWGSSHPANPGATATSNRSTAACSTNASTSTSSGR